jgi:calcineurin-like phosphoesterase family protein
MNERLFTADTHFGHQLLADARGFASVQEHDEAIITYWNEEVSPIDTVLLAGDAVMGNRRENLQLFKKMHGRKILITGNHDDCWPGHPNAWTKISMYAEVFDAILPFARLNIDRRLTVISHFPYTADRTDPPRYMQYRLPRKGAWLLHGHTHSSRRLTSPREIHIGLDAWNLHPVREDRIIAIMRKQHSEEDSAYAAATLSVHQADAENASARTAPADPDRDRSGG